MGYTTQLTAGVAAWLAGRGVGKWLPDGGAYADTDTALVMKALPQAPDRAIAVTAYSTVDDPRLPLGVVAVQLRSRGTSDPRDVDDIADAAFHELHAATHLDLDGLRVVQALRQSVAQLGQDDTGRWQRSDNYYLTTQHPTVNRPEE